MSINNTNPSYPTSDESLDQCILGDDSQDPADQFLLRDGEIEEDTNDEHDQFLTDAEADGDALASAGCGTDEDYGCYGGGDE